MKLFISISLFTIGAALFGQGAGWNVFEAFSGARAPAAGGSISPIEVLYISAGVTLAIMAAAVALQPSNSRGFRMRPFVISARNPLPRPRGRARI